MLRALLCLFLIVLPFQAAAPAPKAVSLRAATWDVWLPGIRLYDQADGSLMIHIPRHENANSLGYLTHRCPVASMLGRTVVVELEIVTRNPPVIFRYDTEPENSYHPNWNPANVRPVIRCEMPSPDDRWWAASAPGQWYILAPGSATLIVPIEPRLWVNVVGQAGNTRPAQFRAAMQRPRQVGVTFGGGLFFGHGVDVSGGHGDFILRRYEVR